MSPDSIACLTLLGYLGAGALVVALRAIRCPQGPRRWFLHSIATLYCRLGCHWRANRICPFLDVHPVLLIANHRSPVDPMLLWAGVTNCRPLEFMTAKEYFGIPGLQFIFDAQRSIPVARDGKDMIALRTALRRLEQGSIVGVFPEGGINEGPGLRPANPGIAWLALQSRAPVYPVFIENAPRGTTMVNAFWSFSRVRIHFGDAIDLSAYYGRRRTTELLQEVTNRIMVRLAELGGLDAAAGRSESRDEEPRVLPLSSASASA